MGAVETGVLIREGGVGMVWALLIIGVILVFLAGCKGIWAVLGIILIFLGLAIDIFEDKPQPDRGGNRSNP